MKQIDIIKEDIKNLKEASEINIQQHKEILDLLKPISETYNTVGLLAKWCTGFLVFLSVLGGVVWTWGNIFRK